MEAPIQCTHRENKTPETLETGENERIKDRSSKSRVHASKFLKTQYNVFPFMHMW